MVRGAKPGRGSLTPAFSLVQASFWMSFCAAVCFAAVHLQALGFSNTELGLVMALGNVLGAVSGPLLAAWAEKKPQLGAAKLNLPLFALRAACLAGLLRGGHDWVTAAFYTAYIALTVPVNALSLKFVVDAEAQGLALDYGMARGMGSLAFVALSAVLGVLTERFGVNALLAAGALVLLLQAAANFLVARRLRQGSAEQAQKQQTETASSLGQFFRQHPRFAVFLLGSVLIYLAHNMIANFMINIAQNVGGDTGTMGYLNAFMAAVEIPVMLLFSRFARGRRASALLAFSCAAFLVKNLAIALAPNVPLLFAALLLQAPAFALYTCAVVPYAAAVVARKDGAKAQSLAFSVTTLGAVLASLVAGRLYDLVSVQTTLLIGTAICAAGAAICLAAIQKTEPTDR